MLRRVPHVAPEHGKYAFPRLVVRARVALQPRQRAQAAEELPEGQSRAAQAALELHLHHRGGELHHVLGEKVRDAEGETSLVKAIGINSPEMRALKAENEQLKADLARAKEDHQYDNLVHQKELDELSKKYRRRINEKL